MIITGREELQVVITDAGRKGLRSLLEQLAMLQELYVRNNSPTIHTVITEARTIVGLLEGSARPDGAQGVLLAGESEHVGARIVEAVPTLHPESAVSDKPDEKKDERHS